MAECIPIQHRVLTLGDIHGIANWQFATEQNRADFLGPFSATDIHKVAYVQESQQYYVLSSVSPITWANFSVPTIQALSYNTVSREIVITMNTGVSFTTSLSAIYAYADTTAATAATNAGNAAVTTANAYTDAQILVVNATLAALNDLILGIQETVRPDPKIITASYTLEPEDHGRLIICDSASSIVITIPDEALEDLGDGFICHFDRRGTGTVTFATTGTDTLEYAGTSPEIEVRYAAATVVRKFDDDVAEHIVWGLYGRLPQ